MLRIWLVFVLLTFQTFGVAFPACSEWLSQPITRRQFLKVSLGLALAAFSPIEAEVLPPIPSGVAKRLARLIQTRASGGLINQEFGLPIESITPDVLSGVLKQFSVDPRHLPELCLRINRGVETLMAEIQLHESEKPLSETNSQAANVKTVKAVWNRERVEHTRHAIGNFQMAVRLAGLLPEDLRDEARANESAAKWNPNQRKALEQAVADWDEEMKQIDLASDDFPRTLQPGWTAWQEYRRQGIVNVRRQVSQ